MSSILRPKHKSGSNKLKTGLVRNNLGKGVRPKLVRNKAHDLIVGSLNTKSDRPKDGNLIPPLETSSSTRGSFFMPDADGYAEAVDDAMALEDLRRTYCWLASKYTSVGRGCLGRSPRGVQAMFEFYLGNDAVIARLAARGLLSPVGPPFGHAPCGRCPAPPTAVWPFRDSKIDRYQEVHKAAEEEDISEDERHAWDCGVDTFHVAKKLASDWCFLNPDDKSHKQNCLMDRNNNSEVRPKIFPDSFCRVEVGDGDTDEIEALLAKP